MPVNEPDHPRWLIHAASIEDRKLDRDVTAMEAFLPAFLVTVDRLDDVSAAIGRRKEISEFTAAGHALARMLECELRPEGEQATVVDLRTWQPAAV